MASLKPWYKVVTPREDLREGRPMDASEFAVHLDKVRDGGAPVDYQDPTRFFERTYLTKSILGLAGEVVRRLSGIQTETSSVFNMTTQFGGGKTHFLTLLYHLAHQGPGAERWAGVPKILDRAGVRAVPKAATAVFVGQKFDVLDGRGGDDGTPKRLTPWGEIAYQLGGNDALQIVAKHDAQRVAPGGDVIDRFLPKDRPCLILVDELMNYLSAGRKMGMAAQTYNFLQNLSEEVRLAEQRRARRLHPGLRAGDERRGPVRLRADQEAARPGRQAGDHVGRGRDQRDHPPPAVRVGRVARRRQEDLRRVRRLGARPPPAAA